MKQIIKNIIRFIAPIIVSPLIIISKIGIHLFRSTSLFSTCSQIVSLLPGKIGTEIRSAYYRFTLDGFGENSTIGFGTLFSKNKTKIGRGCIIGAHAIIGYAEIGDNVGIGSKTSILSGRYQHNFTDHEKGVFEKEGAFSCLFIGKDVVIGEQSVIMANIGEKTVIGAGSVVVKDIPPFSVAVGNPARVVKNRRNSQQGAG